MSQRNKNTKDKNKASPSKKKDFSCNILDHLSDAIGKGLTEEQIVQKVKENAHLSPNKKNIPPKITQPQLKLRKQSTQIEIPTFTKEPLISSDIPLNQPQTFYITITEAVEGSQLSQWTVIKGKDNNGRTFKIFLNGHHSNLWEVGKTYDIFGMVTPTQISNDELIHILKQLERSIQQQFNPIIAACHRKGLTACKTFADVLVTFHKTHKKHKTLRNLPKIMIRLVKRGSLDVTEEELRKFYQLPSKRRQEIVFILYHIQDLHNKEIAEKVNLGDENLSDKQKNRKIKYFTDLFPSKKILYRGVTDKNRVTITHPHLLKAVHLTKNGTKKLEDYSYGSHELFWWLCPEKDCGYEWKAPIRVRTSGHGCPACAGQVVTDRNRVTITQPHLLKTVHPTKNDTKKLENYSYGSDELFWWLCSEKDCEYDWKAPIRVRTSGRGCPKCGGQVVTDHNRVTVTHPHLLKASHPTKNGTKKLENYSYGSNKLFWWLCPEKDCGYEWKAPICARTSKRLPTGCPKCGRKKSMFGVLWGMVQEHAENIVKAFFPNARHQFYISHKNSYIRPDNVVLLDPNAEISDGDDGFDLIIETKQTPWGRRVKECLGKYPQHCKRLIIPYFYGYRKSINHPDLLTGKTKCVDFLTFPELIVELMKLTTIKVDENKLQELEDEYLGLVEFANNL